MGGNSIVPDGRTATSLTVQGRVTSVRTSTFAGGNAYNSFSTFSEAAGNTVNLIVPRSAKNLVNIVRNGAVNIQGTLNSYQNGQIGGNVVFADSYGMVVGKSGVINVGGLTIVTPSGSTLDQIIDSKGNVNAALAAQMIAGNVPLSPDGSVVIGGRINARDFVRITAQDVRIAGSYAEARRLAMHRAQFQSTVNSYGMVEGAAISVRNGSISIVAANDATVAGSLSAGGSLHHAGSVSISAAHNLNIRSTAQIIASAVNTASSTSAPSIKLNANGTITIGGALTASAGSNSGAGEILVNAANINVASTASFTAEGLAAQNGGHIAIKATQTTDVAAGASFAADALGAGNGGLVEISGQTDEVSPDIKINLGSASGNAGTLLFDPDILIIGGVNQTDTLGDNATVSTAGSLYTNGANVVLDASDSIIINGTIDTRAYANDLTSPVAGILTATNASTGNSGSITLDAPNITIALGGALYADVYNGTTNGVTSTWTAGAISLGANTGENITINGVVTGGSFTATASNSITIAGSVDTRAYTGVNNAEAGILSGNAVSAGDSGAISLNAPTITIDSTGGLYADARNAAGSDYTGGAINLTANGTGVIDVAGTLSGGTTVLQAASSITLFATAQIYTEVLDPTSTFSTDDSQNVTLTAPTITAQAGSQILVGAFNAGATDYATGVVTFDVEQNALIVGNPTLDSGDASAPGFLANSTVAAYIAALGGSGTFELAANNSITIDPHGIVSGGALTVDLDATTVTLTGGSSVSGGVVALSAGTVNIDAAANGGAQISTPDLQFSAGTVDLTSAAAMYVGASGDGNSGVAGFLSNATIAGYVADMGGYGTLELSAASSITLDPSAVLDGRQLSAGVSVGDSVGFALDAPTINIAAGSAIYTQSINADGTTYLPGIVTLTASNALTVDGAVDAGSITLTSSDITVAANTLTGATVTFASPASNVDIGPSGSLSNSTIASYLAALTGTSTFVLSADGSITIDSGGVVNGGTSRNIDLDAPTITLAAGSSLQGNTVSLDAGANGTITIDASYNGGAQVVTGTALQFNAAELDLTTSAANMIVGNASTDTANSGAAGFVGNSTIANYAAMVDWFGTLELTATGSITVDGSGVIDARQLTGGASSGNSMDVELVAPSITVSSGGQVLAQAINSATTTYTPGSVLLDASGTGGVTIAGTIKGGDIGLESTSKISLAATAVIDARQLNASGVTTGSPLDIVLGAPAIDVASGASLYGSIVDFAFSQASLTVGGATLSGGNVLANDGVGGLVSNASIADYIAAMHGSGTFELATSVNGELTLNSDAIIGGGSVGVGLSTKTLNVANGAQIQTSVVELDSTQDNVIIGAATDPNANSAGFMSNDEIAALIKASAGAQTFSISANDSIVLDSSAVIDTTNAMGVSLSAPTITENSGAQISASGAVTLTANSVDNVVIGAAEADSEITIDGSITGSSITANATAQAESVYALDSNNDTPGNMATEAAIALLLNLDPLTLNAGYVQSEGTAKVIVGGTLTATGTGAITLTAHTTDVSSDPALGLASTSTFLAGGAVVGTTDDTATVEIENGAHINGGGAFTIAATNAATVAIKTTTITGFAGVQGAPVVVSIAYADSSVNASALIDAGAIINVTGASSAVNVLARNDNSFTASATSYARNGGVAGMAATITDFNSNATATVAASIGTSTAQTGSVTVVADDETAANQTTASATVGEGTLADFLAILSNGGGAVGQAVSGGGVTAPSGLASRLFAMKYGSAMQTGSSALPKAAGAVALSFGTQTAASSIVGAAQIHASGNVAVSADTTDTAFVNLASSAVNSPVDGTSLNPEASLAVSAGVAYADITHNSSAFVGPDVTIDASEIGIAATSSIPSPIENIDWDSFSSILDGLLADKSIVTTGSSATSASSTLGIAGALDFVTFTTNTTAWVGDGATLDATSTSTSSWQPTDLWVDDPASGAQDVQTTFNDALNVVATTTHETINVSGNAGLTGGNVANGAGAVGASLSMVTDNANTYAGIAQGALITSTADIDVDAESFDRSIDASPTNGSGKGINISGIADLLFLNDDTSASISSGARVTANAVTVNAEDTLELYTIAGDFSASGSSGVGIAVTYVDLSGDTQAYVGDNSTVVGTDIDPDESVAPSVAGYIHTGTLDVDAKTDGDDIAVAFVGELADPSVPQPPALPSGSKAASLLGAVGGSIPSTVNISISASGASAVTDSALATEAYLDDATVSNYLSGAPSVQVQAVNDALVVSGSGGVAITLAGASQGSGALSGAVSVESSSNSTLAYITGSTITGMAVDTEALTGGLTVVAGLGLSATNASSPISFTVAGSVSVAEIDDEVAAYIDDSTLSGTGDAIVLADQDTELGIGAGAFFLGGKGGFGLSVTYTKIDDPDGGPATDAYIANSSLTGYTDIDVLAESPQIIYAGAATGGTTTSASVGGAFIFDTLDATTSATISNSGSSALAIDASRNVNVIAGTDPNNIPIETTNAFSSSDSQSSTFSADFGADPDDSSASDQADGALLSGSSAAIVAVAGVIDAGKGTSIGISLVDNTVDDSYVAEISGVNVSASQGTIVSADDTTTILALAVGVGVSTEGYAGEGASVTNTISGGASATVGSNTGLLTTIGTSSSGEEVGSLTLDATDSSNVTAIAIDAAISQDAAGGVAISTNNIETNTVAAIDNADVTTTYNSGLTSATGDIIVESQSTGSILSVAAGVAVSAGSFGAQGSVATNLANGNVTSSVDDSTLFAANNVGVLASNDNSIDTISGAAGVGLGAVGIGISVTTDIIGGTDTTGETYATVTDSIINAEAAGTDTLQIVDGALVTGSTETSSAPESPSDSVTPASVPNLGQDVRKDHGLAIVAGSVETSVVTAITLGVSTSTAAAINVVTTEMGGITKATVVGSSLDTLLPVSTSPTDGIDVSARSVSFANNLAYAVAVSTGGLGGAATVVTNTMDRTTTASVTSTNVGTDSVSNGTTSVSAGDMNVSAYGWEATAGESVGAAGGSGAGVAGSALTNLFEANTTASVDHGTIDAAGLSVTATGIDGLFGADGAGGAGESAGIGASVLVLTSDSTTQASIGDPSAATAATDLTLIGALNVSASGTTDVSSFVIVGSIGGTAGISAAFSGIIVENTTDAAIDNSSVTIADATGTNAAINVDSSESDSIDPVVGSGGVGAAGVGAGVNLVMLKSDDAAWLDGDTVSTAGAVDVTSLSTRDINPITVTAGLGGNIGIAATVGVVLVGSGASSDEMSVLNAGSTNGQPDSGTLGNADGATGSDLTTELTSNSVADGISAEILDGSVTAGSVDVNATSKMAVDNIVGALGIGLFGGGIGAGVGYTDVDQNITAKADGGTVDASSIAIGAAAEDNGSDAHTAETFGVAGAGGTYVGLGAAVGYAEVNNTIAAELSSNANGGTAGATSGLVAVTASDGSTLVADGYGAAGGAAAVGISLADAEKTSSVTADIAGSTDVDDYDGVMVSATSDGSVTSYTIAGAAGILSGAGASSTSKDSETITADVGASSTISAGAAGVLVNAVGTPDLSATSYGVAVGAGIGIGASVAESDAALDVTADVGDSTTISGSGGLTISAASTVPLVSVSPTDVYGDTAYAYAVGAGGGLLLGVQATDVTASDDSTVLAYGGTGLRLPSGAVTIAAENDSSQDAEATGVAVGYVGAGATVAQTSSDASTTAYLDTGAVTASSDTGVLSITATGTDSNTSDATAGSGGIVAGAAAVATTSATSNMSATLKGDGTTDTLYLGGLGIEAQHTTDYSADGDAYQASAVGASGGDTTNNVTSNVTAEVGPNLIINSAAGDMDVIAVDTVDEASGGARAGSGGIAAGAATLSNSNVTQNVTTNIDSGTIFSLNDDPETSTAEIDIEAYNNLETNDSVSLTAGGLFAGGGAESDLTATATDDVNIANNVELFSAGALDIGTATQMLGSTNAAANLYGLVTGAGASTDTALTANQNVTIGDAILEAWGVISIYAGQSGDGAYDSTVDADGTTVVYNDAVIPISAEYSGTASAKDYSNLTFAAGSQVLGVNNVFLGATRGAVNAAGDGTNYNPYLSLFSTENHDNNSSTDGSGNLVLNGTVAAGIHNEELITINYNGNVSLSSGGSPYDLTLQEVSSPSDFNPIVSYNNQTLQYAIVGGFNPYMQIVNELSTLSGLSVSQVESVLSSSNPSITVTNDDSAGDIQREVNTLIQQAPFATNASGASYAFGDIMVSAGNVTIQADAISGSGASVKAADSVKIDFENQGTDFLDLSNLTVTDVSGGHINFTGAATDNGTTVGAITYTEDLTGQTPSIIVDASYNSTNSAGQIIDKNNNVLSTTPDVYFNGAVTNVNGLLDITDQLGNVVATQSYDAATIELLVPNGSFTFNGGAGSIYSTNNAVASQWANTEYKPTDTLTAVEAAATYIEQFYLSYYHNDGGSAVSQSVYSDSDPNEVFSTRLLSAYYDGGNNLTSYIFLPMGYPNNDTNAQTVGTSGTTWTRGEFQGESYDAGDSGPFNCSGCSPFYTVINIQPLSESATAATNPPASVPQIVGKAIILSASVLNINGTIESGQSSNYSVNIGSAAENAINNILDNPTTLAADKQAAAAGNYVDLSSYLTTVGGGDVKIDAEYDALTNQILLNNVVQGAGGYVYLNGKIISTSTSGNPQGDIIVNGGAGTVDVNNTTGVELVTNTINTGVSAASVIEIVDQNKQNTTWYVYNAGASASQQVSTYQEAGVNNTSYKLATLIGTGANSNLAYDPMANQLYEWVDTATLSRTNNGDPSAYGWNFNAVSNPSTAPYTETTSLITGTQSSNYQETVSASGTYQDYSFNTGDKCCGTDFKGTWNQDIYYALTLTLTNTVKASYPIGITFNGGGSSNIDITSNASVVVNGSINNLQGNTSITTTGANSAIVGGASPFVSGESVTLNAPGGIGASGAALPIQTYGGTLTANSVDHGIYVAANGALTINEVKVSPTVAGNTPQGDVYISATGDINSASAYNLSNPVVVGKSIEIDSSGGAIGATTSSVGGVGTLVNINPLVIEATPTPLANGTVDGGLLTSSSSTGTYIVQSTGNLWLDSVTSSGPVFLEAAGADGKTANILNGVTTGGLTAAQTTYLQNVWASLDLATGSGAAAVSGYEQMIDSAYNNYWQLLNLAFPDGQDYNISTQGTAVLSAQIAAQLGYASPSDVSTTQIEAYATAHFAQDEYLLGLISASQVTTEFGSLDALFGTAAGQTAQFQSAPSNAALTSALATYQSNFSYALDPTSTLYASLNTGSQWTLDQLTYTVSANANPNNSVPATPIDNLPLNISGRQVMLYAPTGSIGSLAAPTTFSFTSESDASLSDADKALLAAAGPGQLTVTTKVVDGVDYYTVSIDQQSLVIVSPLGPVSAKAKSQIYLGSATDLLLGGIPNADFGPITAAESEGVQTTSGGDVVLQAIGSILGGVADQVAISGDIADLTLIAEKGSIGAAGTAGSDPATNANALLLALSGPTTGQLDQAEAADGIYIDQTSGDLILGNITGGSGTAGVIQLAASGSIYAEPQFTASAAHIIGSDLDLRAGDNIGFNGSSFQPLQVEISGAVTGSAGGAITIESPESDLNIGAAGTYGVLTSGGAMTLNTTVGDLNIDADITSGGALDLLANGAVTFAAGTSNTPLIASSTSGSVTLISATLSMGDDSSIDAAGAISISTTGDATLGQLDSTLSLLGAANGPSISVTAGGIDTSGAILSNGDGRENVVATGASAGIALWASDGIGASATPLAVDTSTATIKAASGDVFVSTSEALTVTNATATLGSLNISSDAALILESLTAGTTLDVTSTGSTVTIGSATSGGTQTIEAADALNYTTLKTTGIAADPDQGVVADAGDINLTSDTASITGQATGDTLSANGSFNLNAATTISGTSLTATTGSGTVSTAGAINLGTTNVATTLNVTSTGSTVTLGSATSGGTQTIEAKDALNYTTLTTHGIAANPNQGIVADAGDIDLTSDTASITGQATGDTLSANGSFNLNAATTISGTSLTATTGSGTVSTAGAIDLGTTNVATTLGVTSTGSTVTIGSATSGGTQTIEAADALNYTTLTTHGIAANPNQGIVADAGDIDLTSDTASITGQATGDTLSANGSFNLNAATTISGTSLTATTGSGYAKMAGAINFGTTNVATTLAVTSTGSTVTLGSATSGGTQTIEANGALNYTTLTTYGIAANPNQGIVADAGDINLTSDTASITGQAGDTLSANGSFSLNAATTISGTSLTATTGSGYAKTAGAISLGTTNVATTLGVTSTGSTVTLGSATSGGTQTIEAADALNYTTLTTTGIMANPSQGIVADAGDIDLTSDTASITGQATGDTLSANGSFSLNAATTISGTSLTATTGSGTVSTAGAIDLGTTNVATTLGVTSTGSTVTLGSATSGGTQTIEAKDALNYTTLTTYGIAANPNQGIVADAGDINLTSDTASITGQTGDTLSVNGSFSLSAATTISGTSLTATTGSGTVSTAGAISLGTTNVATTLGVTSTGSMVTLGAATSGGTQTIEAKDALVFTQLTTTAGLGGNIDVTSDTSSVSGGSVLADGSVNLTSATSNQGNTVTATTGSVTLLAGSLATPSVSALIDWSDVNAGTTLTATSGGATTLGSATSGGTQTIEAEGALNYTTLKTTGITGDSGNIDLISDKASITGHASGDTLAANGSFSLNAATTISGTSLTAVTGSGLVKANGAIGLGTTKVATTLGVTSTGSTVTLGSATSGGTQTINGNGNVQFAMLVTSGLPSDPGNVTINSTKGQILGGNIQANGFVTLTGDGIVFDNINSQTGLTLTSAADITANSFETQGPVTISAAGSMYLGSIGAGTISLATPGNIAVNNLTVSTAVDFAATNVNIGVMRQTPGAQGPLVMSLTGYNGSVGQSANLTIDSPNGLVITELREDPVTIDTTARQLTVENALLTGTMSLTTPLETFWFNDLSPTPVLGNDVQLYKPDAQFYFEQDNYATTTNALIVQYGQTAAIDQDVDGILYQGASLVRDINRQGEDGDQSLLPDDEEALWSFPVEEFDAHLRALTGNLAAAAVSGALVNADGLVVGNAVVEQPGFKIVFKRVRQ